MSIQDWIHKYPRVQALLQQEDDVLDGLTTEDEGLLSVPPWPQCHEPHGHTAACGWGFPQMSGEAWAAFVTARAAEIAAERTASEQAWDTARAADWGAYRQVVTAKHWLLIPGTVHQIPPHQLVVECLAPQLAFAVGGLSRGSAAPLDACEWDPWRKRFLSDFVRMDPVSGDVEIRWSPPFTGIVLLRRFSDLSSSLVPA
jgi:hypothetical protein